MKAQNELHAGLFILIAMGLFALSIWILGQERQVFAKQIEYYTSFSDIQGLSKGAPIRLGGIGVGRVAEYEFDPQAGNGRIKIVLLINEEFAPRIKEDAVVSIQTQGLLGDKYLSIDSKFQGATLPAGSELKSQESGDLSAVVAKASTIIDNGVEISASLKDFLQNFDKETVTALSGGFKSLGALANEIKDGEGLLHRLVFSKKDGDAIMSDMKVASDSLSEVLAKVKSGDGLLHALIYGDKGTEDLKAFSEAASTIATLSDELTGLLTEIKSGNGVLHTLIYEESPEGIDETLRKLNETVNNLKVASEALARGSGTIGALLVDSQLYDNLVEVTDGAKRSFLLRQAIRSSLDK